MKNYSKKKRNNAKQNRDEKLLHNNVGHTKDCSVGSRNKKRKNI